VSEPAILVENLGKRYQIGLRGARRQTLRDAIMQTAAAPLQQFQRLSGMARANETFWALRDVCCAIEPGEVVGIIGRNGAGKSTLLKILSRITEPTEGRALIHGRVASLLEVGTGFHAELTGRENIYLNGSILGMKRREIESKFDDIVEFSGIEKFIDTPVKRYSSGMTVRLGFAVAAHLESEILIVDEVLAVGDAEFQKKCLGKIRDVAVGGRTVLFVSHHMAAVSRLCKRAIVLESGSIRYSGEVGNAISTYLGQTRVGSRAWPPGPKRPGNDVVRLCAVRLRDGRDEIVESVDVGASIFFEIEYEVMQPGHVIVPNAHVFIADGSCAFVTHDVDPAWRGRARPVGIYRSIVEIPGNFLNEGWITIGAAISTYHPFIVHCFEPDAVTFEVTESGRPGPARGDFAGRVPGVLRPLLTWRTEPSNGVLAH
jgi:lipopolysaccharide transport system ATP-binding protein